MTTRRLAGRHSTFQPAQQALSEVEIRDRFGPLIESAFEEFRSDPSYLIDMAQSAASIAYRRDMDQARADALERGVPVAEIVAERGIKPPPMKPMRVKRT